MFEQTQSLHYIHTHNQPTYLPTMAAILSHASKTSEFETEVALESTPYENWYFLSRESNDGLEYYSAHEDMKHVFFTPVNDDIWNWEMWTVEEYTSDNNTFPLLKSSHGTYILMDHESGFIWQTDDPSSCEENNLITMNITEYPAFEPTEPDDESETEPEIAKQLILKARNRTKKKTPPPSDSDESETEPAPKKKTKKKTPPPSDSDDESETEPAPKKKTKKKTPPSDSDDESEPEPAPKKKTKKKTPPPSDSDDESETEPAPKKKTKKKTDEDKPKRKPNIKLMAFQAYCRDHRPKVKDEHPEAKLGEQQKILGEWWKEEDEEVHAKYTKIATRKAKETSE